MNVREIETEKCAIRDRIGGPRSDAMDHLGHHVPALLGMHGRDDSQVVDLAIGEANRRDTESPFQVVHDGQQR